MKSTSVLSVLLLASSASAFFHKQTPRTHNYYVIHHDPTHASLADVVELLGLEIVEPVGSLENIWLTRTEVPSSTLYAREGFAEGEDSVVESYRRMRSRALLSRRGEDMSSSLKHLSRQTPRKVTQRAPSPAERDPAAVAKRLGIKDPQFPEQWSLINKENPMYSLNVVPVWEDLKYTGKGVIIAVVDDGLMADHKDLESNFAAAQSFDFVGNNKRLPTPLTGEEEGDDEDEEEGGLRESHGTECAGVIASAKNNLCGVGIAFNSKVAGLRIIGPGSKLQDVQEAKALNYEYKDVSIYSCSYGAEEEGVDIQEPPYVTKKALVNGVNNGRDGKGSIFVFATGNGGANDNCNYDGYANSIYTITIGAVDNKGQHVAYSQACTSVMAVTYSSNADSSESIFSLTVDDDEACGYDFGGTSAAAPAASGVFALALEANPKLTWRDMQHLIVKTARVIGENSLWDKLASGRAYSEQFGFGVLDAYAFVKEAKEWGPVKPQAWMMPPSVQLGGGTMNEKGRFSGGKRLSKEGVTGEVKISKDMVEDSDFGAIEHVQVRVWVNHERRGDIEVTLTSPSKISSKVGQARRADDAGSGLQGWTFSTLKHWGEDPLGSWTVKVNDQSRGKGEAIGFSLTFWGSAAKGTGKPYEMPADDHNVFPPNE